jgi:hypothetical protein
MKQVEIKLTKGSDRVTCGDYGTGCRVKRMARLMAKGRGS